MKKRMFYFNPRNDKVEQASNNNNNNNTNTKSTMNQSTKIIGQPKNMPLKSAIPTPTKTIKPTQHQQQQQQLLQPVQRSSTTLSFNSEATYDSLTSTQLNNVVDSMDLNSCNESQVFNPKSKQHFKLFEEVKNLDLRTRQLIDKTESTLSDKVSSEGIGSSTSSTTTSNLSQFDSTIVETSHKPDFVKYLENKTNLLGNNNLKSENDDILYQWRLRRKLEEAKNSTLTSNNLNIFQTNEPKTQMQQFQPTQNHLLLHRLTANNALFNQKLQIEKANEINSQLPPPIPISPAISTVTATTNTTAATTTITIPEISNPPIKTVQNSVATQTNVNASVQTSLEVNTLYETERHSLKSKYGYDEFEKPTKDNMITSQKENILFDNKEKHQNKSRNRGNNQVIKSTASTSTNCSIVASSEQQNQPVLCHKSKSPTRRIRSSSLKTSIITEQSNISDLTKVSSVFDESKLCVQSKFDREEQKEQIQNKEIVRQQVKETKSIEEDAEKIDSKLLEKLENDEILIMLYKQSFYYESKLKEIDELLQAKKE